jgi:hypothetical protein
MRDSTSLCNKNVLSVSLFFLASFFLSLTVLPGDDSAASSELEAPLVAEKVRVAPVDPATAQLCERQSSGKKWRGDQFGYPPEAVLVVERAHAERHQYVPSSKLDDLQPKSHSCACSPPETAWLHDCWDSHGSAPFKALQAAAPARR